MLLTIEVPDQIAHNLHLEGSQADRRALEMLALEGYREGMLSRGAVAKMLNLSFTESEQFLYQNKAFHEFSLEEFEDDAAYLSQALSK